MEKELTLLICCHQHGHHLKRMLEDVFNQTLSVDRWKMLIIFDECTDNSEEMFKEAWSDLCAIHGHPMDYLEHKILVREKKAGLAACKNFGIDYCDTKYVAYLDADDGMFPERLEKQLDFLNRNDGCTACFTQTWDRDEHGRLLTNCFIIGQYELCAQIAARIDTENVLCHGSAMLIVEDIKNVGGYKETSDVFGMEDWDLWKRMLNADYYIYNMPERLYIWSMGTSVER